MQEVLHVTLNASETLGSGRHANLIVHGIYDGSQFGLFFAKEFSCLCLGQAVPRARREGHGSSSFSLASAMFRLRWLLVVPSLINEEVLQLL